MRWLKITRRPGLGRVQNITGGRIVGVEPSDIELPTLIAYAQLGKPYLEPNPEPAVSPAFILRI
ncbi:MAG: hypothetical protein Q7N50_09225 [Armatimonadota bacterium]|nr:hypothetical protein [Armatimonadota bacterium]